MKGRKPKPTNLKVITGNPGKRPLNKNEPKFVAGLPEPPDFLTEKALAEWKRMGPQLVETGVITEGDMAIFAAYCQSWARWKELEALQAKAPLILGEKIKNADGSTSVKFRHNRLLSELNQAMAQTAKYAAELGLTPSARSRIKASPAPKKNKWADL